MNRIPRRMARVVSCWKCVWRRVVSSALPVITAVAFVTAARAQSFSTPLNLSNDGHGTIPQIVADSGGNIDIAYGEGTGTDTVGGVRFVQSIDGGRTFSKPVDVATGNASHFSLALESACTVDIAYFQSGDVFFSQSA